MLKINLSSFEDYTELELESDGAELQLDESVKIEGPVSVNVSVTKESVDSLLVTGTLSAGLKTECVRCLEETTAVINSGFTTVFKAKGALTPADKADDIYTYEDNTLDLSLLIKDELMLALPMKPVCSRECLGLCPVCGKNKNREACDCKIDTKLNPFEVLDKLKTEN